MKKEKFTTCCSSCKTLSLKAFCEISFFIDCEESVAIIKEYDKKILVSYASKMPSSFASNDKI
jgi:hypothetical protein